MTNAAAVIGLKVDGTDIQQDPWGIFLELVRGLNEPPSVRGVDSIIPGRPGRRRRNREADVRELELRGWVAGIGDDEAEQRSSFRTLWETLRGLLPVFGDAADIEVEVEATLEDGTVTTIMAVAKPGWIVGLDLPSMRSVSIELDSMDPLWSHEGS